MRFRTLKQTNRSVRVAIALILALGTGTVAYTVISAADLNPAGPGDESVRLAVNTYVNDPDVTITNAEMSIVLNDAGAGGATQPGVEATIGSGELANGVLNAGNFSYTFVVRESGLATWTVGENFRIRLYGNDVAIPQTTLLATLYVQQAVQDGANVEGVTVTFDLGFTDRVQDDFTIIVDRQAEI